MAVPSLGQAIGLQGRNQFAEDLGRTIFQMGEAEKNRNLKLLSTKAAAQAKAQKETEDDIQKLFQDREGYHPLVYPKVRKTLEDLMGEIQKDKLSGNPYASNRRAELMRNAMLDLGEYKSASDSYKKLSTQLSVLGKGNYFVDPVVKDFIDNYYTKATDYKDLQQRLQKDNFQFGGGLNMTDFGTIEFNPEMRINYTKDIVDATKPLKTIKGEFMRSLPYDSQELKEVSVVPFTREDAKTAYEETRKRGLNIYAEPPTSVEDVVENYMDLNPTAVNQFVRSARLNVQIDPNLGDFSPADKEIIKNEMMKIALPYTNPQAKGRILKESKGTNVSISTETQVSPAAPSIGKQDEIVGFSNNKKVSAKSFSKWGLPIENFSWTTNASTFNDKNEPVSGQLKDMKIEEVSVYPYIYNKNTGGYSRYLDGGNAAQVLGVKPFVKFGNGSNTYYVPLDDVSTNEFLKSKFNAANVTAYLQSMKDKSQSVSAAMKNKKFASEQELYNFVEQNYK